jgi:hypothetical protein
LPKANCQKPTAKTTNTLSTSPSTAHLTRSPLHQQPTTNNQQPTTNNQQPTTNHPNKLPTSPTTITIKPIYLAPRKTEVSMSTIPEQEKIVIGSKEKILLPEIRKSALVARVDTGAKTSALHCYSVQVEKMDHKEVLCVKFARNSKSVLRFPKFSRRNVKSSNGTIQHRFVVPLQIIFGGKTYKTSFTLTNRSDMNFAALLGRRFLSKRFIVDVSLSYTLSSAKK